MTPALIAALTTAFVAVIGAVASAIVAVQSHGKAALALTVARAFAAPPFRVMYDSVDSATIPANATIIGCYSTGKYANVAAMRTRFPNARLVQIDTTGLNPEADVRDWETGDKSGNLRQWVIDHNTHSGKKDAVIYCNRDTLPEVRRLTGDQMLGVDYWLWQANLDGTFTAVYPTATVAVQGINANGYDISYVFLPWWKAILPPPPPPPPPPPIGVTNWHSCTKCGGLVYGAGRCAAGGEHVLSAAKYPLKWEL
jgi:hypothetical protein